MNNDSTKPDDPGFDSILASLIEAQERAKDQSVDINAWTEKYPQYAAQIHSFFANRGKLEEVLGPRAEVDAEAATIGVNTEAGDGQRIRYFGDYELLSEIARGGMGVVFKARQVSLNRIVAVKMILSGNLAGPSDVQRFHAEAESAANLDHPHIVPIYEVGEHEGQHYFSMKLIEGSSLSTAKNHRPANESPKEKQRWAASLVAQVARAVHHAHQRGILHRDLKPGNILIDHHGEPHVTDFGLAKKVEGGSDLTNTGAIVGTPAYMAPEQARSEKGLSTAVDVYSLGAILYELLTGRPPFKADSPLDTILEVLEKEPARPSSITQSVDRDLETITLKCLEKDPARRFGSAEALAEELERWERGEPITIRPVGQWERGWRWCKRNRAVAGLGAGIAAVLMIASVVASGLAWWALDNAKQADTKADEAIAEKKRADFERTNASNEAIAARRLLGMSRVDRGLIDWQSGDYPSALLSFAEQAVVDSKNDNAQYAARHRVANYRRHTSMSPLFQIVTDTHRIPYAAFSPDGQYFVVAGDSPKVCNVATGKAISPVLESSLSNHASFSPDGKRVVVCSWGQAQLFDALNGQKIGLPMKHKYSVRIAQFSKNGRFLITAGGNNELQVWDTVTSKPASSLMNHSGSGDILAATYSPDCQRIISGSSDKTARIWDATSGQLVVPPLMHRGWVHSATFSSDGKTVLTGDTNTARIWDSVTGKQIGSSMTYSNELARVIFSPDGKKVAMASYDGTALIWNASTGQVTTKAMKHHKAVNCIAFSKNGKLLATGSEDGTACVWNVNNGERIMSSIVVRMPVNHVCFSPDDRYLLAASGDFHNKIGEVRIIDVVPPDDTMKLVIRKSISQIAFDRDCKMAVLGSVGTDGSCQISIISSENNKTIAPTIKHADWINSVEFSLDGKYIVSTHGLGRGKLNEARIWEVATGQSVGIPMPHSAPVLFATFSNDGRVVVTTSQDNTARLWDAKTGKPISEPLKHTQRVNHAMFSPDSKHVITTSGRNSTKGSLFFAADIAIGVPEKDLSSSQIWEVETGKLIVQLDHPNNDVGFCYVNFSHDGRRVVTCSVNNTAQIWDTATGKPVAPPLTHQGEVNQAVFSPDNQLVVSVSGDKTARVWDVETGQAVVAPLQHQEYVVSACFSHDGRRIATASIDKTTRIWDTRTGQPISPPLVHGDAVFSIAFSPDDCRLLTGTRLGIKVWDISPDSRPWSDLLRLIQVQAGLRLDEVGTKTPLNPQTELLPWFHELKAKYPADFSVTPEQARRWRLQQIADCCKERNLPAALFHQNWLLAEAVMEAAKARK